MKYLRSVLPILILVLTISTDIFSATPLQRCKSIEHEIKRAHLYYFGLDYPYLFSLAQAQVESQCRHQITSSDGIGSEGFAQITFRWWNKYLLSEGIKEIKSITNHAKAQAFILRYEYDRTYCKKLFEMYQRYNGGSLVTMELKKAGSCEWSDGYNVCSRKDVCVLKTKDGCKQYRNACDINYEYSVHIYDIGIKFGARETWVYW